MIPCTPPDPAETEHDEDLLTRAQASAFLARFGVRLKPSSLARMFCVGSDGPACIHIRRKPYYPRGELGAWARAQRSGLRKSARAPADAKDPAP